ncbi:MAG: sigma-70 family RNA polymerase sigma factor, partial [Acidobacteriales bacterium]|nr:sigma-70 family RNA polymerase sigma factor [Terriglobales bacterium]
LTFMGPHYAGLDERQFELFYQATAPALLAYIMRITLDGAHSQDILQESYVRLLNAPALAETQRRSFLYRAATRLAVDHWRKHRRELPLRIEDQERWAASESLDLNIDMRKILARLSGRERALLWLAYVENVDHARIAAILGLRALSVRVLLFRARAHLRRLLKQHGFSCEERS